MFFSDWTRMFGGTSENGGSSMGAPVGMLNQSHASSTGAGGLSLFPSDVTAGLFSDPSLGGVPVGGGAAAMGAAPTAGSAFLPSQLMDMSNLDHFQVIIIFRPHIMGEENHNLCCLFFTNSAKSPLYNSI